MPLPVGDPTTEAPAYDGCSVDSHLYNWARWMRGKDLPEGLPDEACGGIVGYQTVDWDSEGTYAKLDAELAEHCNAAVESLPPAHRCALYVEHNLTAAFHFPRQNFDAVLGQARVLVRAILIRRGVVVT